MGDLTVGKPVIATSTKKIETVDDFELSGSYEAGSELITNGGFVGNANGWTLNDTGSYADGKVTVLYAEDDDPVISAPVTLQSGLVYLVSFEITDATDGISVYFTNQSASSPSYFGNGVRSFLFTADNSGVDEIFFDSINYEAATGWTIDNVSVKAVSDINAALKIFDGLNRLIFALGNGYAGNYALGLEALLNNLGENNIAIGDRAGSGITTGKRNIAIGAHVDVLSPTGNDQIAIGEALRYNGGEGWHFNGGTPTIPLLPASPTALQVAQALELIGLATISA